MVDKAIIAIVYIFIAFFLFNLAKATYAAVKSREYKKILIGVAVLVFLVLIYWYVNSGYYSGERCASYDTRGCTE